jgi:hypothetical protein
MPSEYNGSSFESLSYRFSGYQLPLLQWDETGPAWVKLPPHPYFRNQPILWQDSWTFGMPAFSFTGDPYIPSVTNAEPNDDTQECSRVVDDNKTKDKSPLIRMLPF